MKINVTAEDIRLGKRGTPNSCPIARAIKRRLTNRDVWVSDSEVWVKVPFRRYVDLPKEARDFVKDFDRSRDVKPFSFNLELPQ